MPIVMKELICADEKLKFNKYSPIFRNAKSEIPARYRTFMNQAFLRLIVFQNSSYSCAHLGTRNIISPTFLIIKFEMKF